MLIVGCTLVRSLVGLRLFPADVNDQSPGTGLHQHLGVFLHIEVGPVPRPRKAKIMHNSKHHVFFFSRLSGNEETREREEMTRRSPSVQIICSNHQNASSFIHAD